MGSIIWRLRKVLSWFRSLEIFLWATGWLILFLWWVNSAKLNPRPSHRRMVVMGCQWFSSMLHQSPRPWVNKRAWSNPSTVTITTKRSRWIHSKSRLSKTESEAAEATSQHLPTPASLQQHKVASPTRALTSSSKAKAWMTPLELASTQAHSPMKIRKKNLSCPGGTLAFRGLRPERTCCIRFRKLIKQPLHKLQGEMPPSLPSWLRP